MKIKITALLYGLFLMALATEKVCAVWPPSTELKESATHSVEQSHMPQGMNLLNQKLEEDERQLAEIVELLKRDQKRIQELTEMYSKNPAVTPPSKKGSAKEN